MTRDRFSWEVRFALGQVGLAITHTVRLVEGWLTLNSKIEKELDADLKAYLAKMEAERPA